LEGEDIAQTVENGVSRVELMYRIPSHRTPYTVAVLHLTSLAGPTKD
jgi:hypothetical protein